MAKEKEEAEKVKNAPCDKSIGDDEPKEKAPSEKKKKKTAVKETKEKLDKVLDEMQK